LSCYDFPELISFNRRWFYKRIFFI